MSLPASIAYLRVIKNAVEAGCAGLYVDTENERLLWYYQGGGMVAEPFALERVDVPLYLKTYGLTVSQQANPDRVRRLAPLLDLILAFWPQCASWLEEWSQEVKDHKKNALLKPAKEPGLFEERFLERNARLSRYCSECADGIFKGKE